MEQPTSHAPYTELLKEFREKVEYLKIKYRLEQRQIAAAIGLHPTNLSRYLDTRRDKPCSMRQLSTMVYRVKDCYAGKFMEAHTPEPDIHAALNAVEHKLNSIHSLLFELLGRSKEV